MKRILVVDDDVDILALVQMMLHMNHFAVEAISRWEAIDDRIEEFAPDLILLDISLVGADGREICKKLKQAEETKHIPVILFSANADMGATYRDCQAENFIEKPFALKHLLETITAYV